MDFEKHWLGKFSDCISGIAGDEIRDEIMEGSEELSDASSIEEITSWTNRAMKNLTYLLEHDAQVVIMTGCACHYPESELADIKIAFQKTKDIKVAHNMLQQKFESLLKNTLKLDKELINTILNKGMGSAGVLNGNKIIATKIPKSGYIKQYFQVTNPDEKRALYCHCPRVRDVINMPIENIPEIYCYCGAGFYKDIWEQILQKPVKVEVLSTVMKGDDVCKIAIHLPIDLLNKENKKSDT